MLFFLYFAFRDTDFEQLLKTMQSANYWWIIAILPPLIASHALRAWRWEYLLRPVKRELKFRNLFSALMIGYSINNVLPRVGELVRPYAIGKTEGVSRSAAFGTVLMERIFDIISFIFVILLIPLVYSGPLKQVFPWLEETGIWVTIITSLVFFIFVFLMMRRDIVVSILNFFTRYLSPRKASLIEHITHSFLDGFLFLKEPRSYFIIGILSILIWMLYIVMMYLPFYAFGLIEKYSLDIGTAIVIQAISSIGYLMPTPGATGPFHYFTIESLTRLYGVDKELAVSYATATHAVGYIGVTLIGVFYFFKDNMKFSEVMQQERPFAQNTQSDHKNNLKIEEKV